MLPQRAVRLGPCAVGLLHRRIHALELLLQRRDGGGKLRARLLEIPRSRLLECLGRCRADGVGKPVIEGLARRLEPGRRRGQLTFECDAPLERATSLRQRRTEERENAGRACDQAR